MSALRLIVGLGNPGPQYRDTRHNVGQLYVESLAQSFGIELKEDAKFDGLLGRGLLFSHDVRLLVPLTYMNDSGRSVGPLAHFYKIEPEQILVIYDEVAFEPGITKLKVGGGANGHNGIKSVIDGLGKRKDFLRLRIGVGHPGDKNKVTRYLTGAKVPEAERRLIEDSLRFPDDVWRHLLKGDLQKAMTLLHSTEQEDEGSE